MDTSIGGPLVVPVLERVIAERGRPAILIMDKSPEFVSRGFHSWAYAHSIQLHFIEPGKAKQNAYVERFEATCGMSTSSTMWRLDYNGFRPHSSWATCRPRSSSS